MSCAQSYIHLIPSNVKEAAKQSLRFNKIGSSVRASTTTKPVSLKIHLEKFPSFIGHASSRVNRMTNEDAYSLNMLKLPTRAEQLIANKNRDLVTGNSRNVLNLSIYDGHGGEGRVSKLLASEFHKMFVDKYPTQDDLFDLLDRYRRVIGGQYWNEMYKNRESFYDRYIRNCNTKQEQVLFGSDNKGSRMIFDKWGNIIDKTSLLTEFERLRLYYSYLKFDLENCCGLNNSPSEDIDIDAQAKKFPGGSTASSIYLSSHNEQSTNDDSFFIHPTGLFKLVVTQVGDTRIILCDKNGVAHPLTKLHHPSSSRETKRLNIDEEDEEADSFGEKRFLNNFANTRAFGDLIGKKEGLSAEPDIYSYLVGDTRQIPHSEKSKLQFGGDECFVCMVTDGVSDVLSDQEVIDLITSTVNMRGLRTASPQYLADEVVKFVQEVGDRHADNATCVLLRLPNWGNWPSIDRTGAQREEKLMGWNKPKQ
ncbi:[Pyruvate dehydrogenase [acetyl-transferring]]-phosphatase 2, mitochondrial [Nakaseomyces bracarensis]|uniref:[Pyruvate dehydrogenase [acetyl-transferring]]-phosphatase 2, mitochondrial n=1 Tax=Nakaseomyces bracarensis TaxID=273131 RepID=A0ABR4NT31_9SACH